jgi:hypothetical protein
LRDHSTEGLGRWRIETLRHQGIEPLRHSNTKTLRHQDTQTPRHSDTEPLKDREIGGLKGWVSAKLGEGQDEQQWRIELKVILVGIRRLLGGTEGLDGT